ncbi:protein adenylyltransferase SelO [Paenibacillus antibioticophila]|uniref:protein adenylyltransferase SelO n=1 Tax=Paenibacillus antibioticophila TaxID=1274374 RepID=UPI0005CA08C2|nr:YdiU family protein [Paenibacillus antibioticophila]
MNGQIGEPDFAGWRLEHSYAELPSIFFTRQEPQPVRAPELTLLNDELAEELGLRTEELRSPAGVGLLSGCRTLPGSKPLAQAYAGHQFGYFTMLGDGRALLLGEQRTPDGKLVDIQLKGSGRTPYSRSGDGRAALGPMLREYVISEAMHGLGIPTTRSLAVVTTGQPIQRERELPGAVLTRVAASHLRVGTFQFAAAKGSKEELRALADYAIGRHDPDLQKADQPYLALLNRVISRQASLIASWQLVGFVHGVMNTDNMTISGETIDYGPCAFMDTYDPATVFSSIDSQGRYAYGNQPAIAVWNLARLAEALLPLLHEEQEHAVALAEQALAAFSDLYRQHWLAGMARKLGLFQPVPEDEQLVSELLRIMETARADYTHTFRLLTLGDLESSRLQIADAEGYGEWRSRWQERLGQQPESAEQARELMKRSNPAVIPRNHRVEEALEAAEQGELAPLHRLLAALRDPYAYSAEQESYAELPPQDCAYRTYCGT